MTALAFGLLIAQLGMALSAAEVKRVAIPERPPADLKPYASLASRASIEPSGMVKSRRWPDLYWTLNDSGDEPRIFPVHKDGSIYRGEDHEDSKSKQNLPSSSPASRACWKRARRWKTRALGSRAPTDVALGRAR